MTVAVLVAILAGAPAMLLVCVTAWGATRLLRRRRVEVRARRRRLSMAERTRVLDRDGWACVYCGATEQLELDHIVPYSRGGADTEANMQVLCLPCNRRKSNR